MVDAFIYIVTMEIAYRTKGITRAVANLLPYCMSRHVVSGSKRDVALFDAFVKHAQQGRTCNPLWKGRLRYCRWTVLAGNTVN